MAPRVRIQELQLSGFRAFANARLEFEDLTVLVGRNGSGKSTLLDALEFIRDALSGSLESALALRGGLQALLHTGLRRRELALSLKLHLSSRFLREVSKSSGLPFAGWDPRRDASAVYGFRLGLKRGGAGFLVKHEVAHA